MRWLVTGARGMLGHDVLALLHSKGMRVEGTDRDTLDITDERAVSRAVKGFDVVLNCAAWTAVDDAESQEASAFAVNAVGPALLARAARLHRARMVQVSTDYIFEGGASTPYDADAAPAPRSAYGRTKLAGEWAVRAEAPDHLIVRTAWLYGAHGACFPKTIARVASERGGLDVIDDQVGQPTWTVDLADLIFRLVEAGAPSGSYHGTSSGEVSWNGFARAVVESAGMDPSIVRATTSEAFARPAPRPAYSVLGHGSVLAAGVAPISDWADRWRAAATDVLSPAKAAS
ncbi:dTDP-4-dehydrorhamnose reductase [Cellulomonas chengniuliangii]|uniref:dTDP-4-dehydrorhamnose reductase n=1 Tax=Cellulomonas chengniuliangii TaxID=2968084 RepID=A0ABY5KXC1_9CELL|nr:dTDP-4-dehydrorhamnose reductase [Cellulomonas chengniuliangii]MCC2308746.1 dTDP-4-dehydrorhamnose reductase [Cellulomonas chengniuliangii]UUI74503.1 dTDP-4-dehydrorhamnose reductase [Cellulomonas chengniuliangii]